MPTFPRVNILGVGISAINLQQAVAAIDGWIANGPSPWCFSRGAIVDRRLEAR